MLSQFTPPWLEVSLRLRAKRLNEAGNPCMFTYWKYKFTFDTLVMSPITVTKKLFELFKYTPEKKEWVRIRKGILSGLTRAGTDIPDQYRPIAKALRKKLESNSKLRVKPLSRKEKSELSDIATDKNLRVVDLLALPVIYQRKLIERYLSEDKKSKHLAERWLCNRGYRIGRYVAGNPASLFIKPLMVSSTSNLKYRRGF